MTPSLIEKKTDEYWMWQALMLAQQAADADEVPVGAIVVQNERIIGRGFNQPISCCDPTAHAEIQALRDAAKRINNYRLNDATLYVTIEPCSMCAGAMVHSRIKRLVFGALEPKAGAIVSQNRQLEQPHLNHKVLHTAGVCADECSQIMSQFFSRRRKEKAEKKRQKNQTVD
ncbi:tRNA adenosine(34) deaminase TadA [Eionea flava]